MVNVITEQNFEEIVVEANLPVILDFYASWCGPCKQMAPVFQELSDELDNKVIFGKVNVDENITLAKKYRVMQVPTFLFLKDKKVVSRETGGISKEELEEEIKELLF